MRLAMLGTMAVLAAACAWALSGEELERRVLEISSELRCPTCQAISVKDSEAAFSRQIRGKVRAMLAEGKTEEQIKDFFVSRYGEWILRAPKKRGVGLILWFLPGGAILFVGGLVGLKLYRNARSREALQAGAAEDTISEADRSRIERDLRRFEEG